MLERVIMLVMRVIMWLQTQCLASIALIQKEMKKLYEFYKSWVAFLQGFFPINPSGRVNWGPFSFWE